MPSGQRKLRDSCDACHIAKVKCIRNSTECLRCASSGALCSFSPSDRRGKPRGAKNKVNRTQNGQTTHKAPSDRPKTQTPQSKEAFKSSGYEFEGLLDLPPGDFLADVWLPSTVEEPEALMQTSSSEQDALAAMTNNWMSIDANANSNAITTLQHHLPQRFAPTAYPDPTLNPALPFTHSESKNEQEIPLEVVSSEGYRAEECSCYPISLQSLYALHRQAIFTTSGSVVPFDVALVVNNKAITRSHAMLACSSCVLNQDQEKSSTNMLMLAGAMDDILVSYNSTFLSYLGDSSRDSLVFSSSETSTSKKPTSTAPPRHEGPEFHPLPSSSSSSSTSSSTSGSMGPPSSRLSLGTYRVEGEDGRHLRLEILKIELRKVERLWITFRDTCAMQNFDDEQKSLYAALVCYLAKKLRRTSDMLESRRRSRPAW